MRKTTFTRKQIATILREADEEPVVKVARRHGISNQAIYNWRKRSTPPGAPGGSGGRPNR
jgi:putative transposase